MEPTIVNAPQPTLSPRINTDGNPNLKQPTKGFFANKKRLAIILFAFVLVGVAILIRSFAAVPVLLNGDGEFTPMAPTRILDTRNGIGGYKVAAKAGQTLKVKVAGVGGIPANNVRSIVMNVTAVAPTASGYLTVWPTNTALVGVPSLNFTAKQAVSNQVTAAVGEDGYVQVFNSSGNTHIVFDIAGYHSKDGGPRGLRYSAVKASRVLDTRNGLGGYTTPVAGGKSIKVRVTGLGGVPAGSTQAVVLGVTAVGPTSTGFMAVWPSGQTRPNSSSLNYVATKSTSNMVTVKVGADGYVMVDNSAGNTNVVIDVQGYYAQVTTGYEASQKGRFIPTTPKNFVDTKAANYPMKPAENRIVYGISNVDGGYYDNEKVDAVVLTVTVVQPASSGFVRLWPEDQPAPTTSNMNYTAGQTISNQVIVKTSDAGRIRYFTSAGTTNIVIDRVGVILKDKDRIALQTQATIDGNYKYNAQNTKPEYEYDLKLTALPGVSVDGGWETSFELRHYLYGNSSTVSALSFGGDRIVIKDGKGYFSYSLWYLNGSTKYAVLAPGGSVINDSNGKPSSIQIPYAFTANATYRFKHEVLADQPGYPGNWETISVTAPNGAVIPLVKAYSSPTAASPQYSTYYSVNMAHETGCNNPTLFSASVTNFTYGGILSKSTYGNSSLRNENISCPGAASLSKVVEASGTQTTIMALGIAATNRDVVKPIIQPATVTGKKVTVTGTDNKDVRKIIAQLDGQTVRQTFSRTYTYTNQDGSQSTYTSTLTESDVMLNGTTGSATFDLSVYPAGQYSFRSIVEDASGNTSEQTQTITLQ